MIENIGRCSIAVLFASALLACADGNTASDNANDVAAGEGTAKKMNSGTAESPIGARADMVSLDLSASTQESPVTPAALVKSTSAVPSPDAEHDQFGGTWTGKLEGYGRAAIESKGDSSYHVDLTVDVPAPPCSGGIEGNATVKSGKLVLEKSELGETCRIIMTPEGHSLKVTEHGCLSWHGASCGFTGSLNRR